jgi:hypothetical protein
MLSIESGIPPRPSLGGVGKDDFGGPLALGGRGKADWGGGDLAPGVSGENVGGCGNCADGGFTAVGFEGGCGSAPDGGAGRDPEGGLVTGALE